MAKRSMGNLLLAAAVWMAGCDNDPVALDGFSTEELTTELAITPDHVHVYETLVTFTVSVVDPDGGAVTDFDLLQVERRIAGTTTWSILEATRQGGFYAAEQRFEASGEYEIRVMGLRPSDDELVLLYEQPTLLNAVRPHADVDGYHLTLEPDPGHIHEGDTSDIRFWILDKDSEEPVSGLTATVWVEESDGTVSEYDGDEGADGLYHASHSFSQAGATVLGVRFVGADQQEHEWSLEMEVHEAH